MQALPYSIRYEGHVAEKDTLRSFAGAPSLLLAKELATAFLANQIFDIDPERDDQLGEPVVCQISLGLFEVQFRTLFCDDPESVVVQFYGADGGNSNGSASTSLLIEGNWF